jgi:hypothetical protein
MPRNYKEWKCHRKENKACLQCKNPADPGVLLCDTHRRNSAAREKSRRARLEASGLCNSCGRLPPIEQSKLCSQCREKNRAISKITQRNRRAQDRALVFAYYGTSCACCGEARDVFLSIDHIDGEGAAHRRELNGAIGFYRWLVKNRFPSGFRTLCMNCQWGYRNGAICPHQLSTTSSAL